MNRLGRPLWEIGVMCSRRKPLDPALHSLLQLCSNADQYTLVRIPFISPSVLIVSSSLNESTALCCSQKYLRQEKLRLQRMDFMLLKGLKSETEASYRLKFQRTIERPAISHVGR